MTYQYNQPSSRQQSIPNPLLASRAHPNVALASPFMNYAASLTPDQFDADLGVGVHGHHILQSMLGHQLWCSIVSLRTSQIFRPEVPMPYTKPREASATAHDYL